MKGRKILIGWVILSWAFIVIFGLIPINSAGENIICLLANNIGMPTGGSFDDILNWSPLHQVIFAIGGMMFLTVPITFVVGLLVLLSCGAEKLTSLVAGKDGE